MFSDRPKPFDKPAKRPTNDSRSMPSLSFSLASHHIDAIRDAAIRQQVSQSQVVREALDNYFPQCGEQPSTDDDVPIPRASGTSPALARLVRELATLRRELVELRQIMTNIDYNRRKESDGVAMPPPMDGQGEAGLLGGL
jgi:hypothetical protein